MPHAQGGRRSSFLYCFFVAFSQQSTSLLNGVELAWETCHSGLLAPITMRGNWRIAGGSRLLGIGCSRTSSSSAKSSANETNQRLRSFRRIVQERHSARRFEPNVAVPDHVWLDVVRMTATSPSGFNLQPWNAILLRDPEIRSRISKHSMLGKS